MMYETYIFFYLTCACLVSSNSQEKSRKRYLNKALIALNQPRDVMTDVINQFALPGHKSSRTFDKPAVDYFNNGASWANYISSPVLSKNYPEAHGKNIRAQLGYDDQYASRAKDTSFSLIHAETYPEEYKSGDNTLSGLISTPVFDDATSFKSDVVKHKAYPLHTPQSDKIELHNSRSLLHNLNSMMTPLNHLSSFHLKPTQTKAERTSIHVIGRNKENLQGENRKHGDVRGNLYNNEFNTAGNTFGRASSSRLDQRKKSARVNYLHHPVHSLSNNRNLHNDNDDDDVDDENRDDEGGGFINHPSFDFEGDREKFHEDFDEQKYLHENPEFNEKPEDQEIRNYQHNFRAPFDNPPPDLGDEDEDDDWRFKGGRHIHRNNDLFEYGKPDFFKQTYKEKEHSDRNHVENRLIVANKMLSVLPLNAIKKLVLFNKNTKNLPAPEISLPDPFNIEQTL